MKKETANKILHYSKYYLGKNEIVLEVKNVYGKDLIYPSCHIANAMIKLKNAKTFTKNDVEVFKSLGLIIKWKAQTIWLIII